MTKDKADGKYDDLISKLKIDCKKNAAAYAALLCTAQKQMVFLPIKKLGHHANILIRIFAAKSIPDWRTKITKVVWLMTVSERGKERLNYIYQMEHGNQILNRKINSFRYL